MNIKSRLDSDLHAAAKVAAAQQGVSLSVYIRQLLMSDLTARGLSSDGDGVESCGSDGAGERKGSGDTSRPS